MHQRKQWKERSRLSFKRSAWCEELEDRRLLTNGVFVHPGILNIAADYTRMSAKVAANAQPWLADWQLLQSYGTAHLGQNPSAQTTIDRGGSINNFGILWNDIDRAYEAALEWKVSGNTAYADQAVHILNAWATTMTSLTGSADRFLASGLYGVQWAVAAEVMRSYSGWAAADQTTFQNYLLNIFYPMNHDFLTNHNGAYITNYWANWDLCNISSMMAIGIFCDRHDIYNEALSYCYNGAGNGAFDKAIYYIHAGNLGQGQEEGRDQGHSNLDIQSLGLICQMAWNQGDDLFSYRDNAVLAATEYLAKYNLYNDVPYETYNWFYGAPGVWSGYESQTAVSGGSRGQLRPIFELMYNHYVTLQGLSAPYTTQALLNHTRPEGEVGNGDGPGWGTLTFALDPVTTPQPPQNLVAYEKGAGNIQLNFWGGNNDQSYKIYRATSSSGPFTQIASGVTDFTYTDTNVPAGTYYYQVTGINGATETVASNTVIATSSSLLAAQLPFNESSGTTATDSTGNGVNGTLNGGASFVAGRSGNAVSLNGSNGYVSLPGSAISGLADFTISTWVYLNSSQTWARVFDFGRDSSQWMMLTVKNSSGVPEFSTNTIAGSYNKQSVTGNAALPTNQWVHLAMTLSNHLATLYVNGIAVGSNAKMDFPPYEISGTLPNAWLGRSQYTSDPYLNGKIDDFRIYRGAMTTGQIYTQATGLTPPAVPGAPTSLSAAPGAANQIILNWNSVAGATSYSVYRSTSPSGPFSPIATLFGGMTYADSGLTADTTYYYMVTAANNGGEGAFSTQATATALPPLPVSPTGLTAKAVTSSTVALSWVAGANAYTYSVKRAVVSGGPYATIASGITGTTFTDSGLTTGTRYYYVVTAVNTAGVSANSNEDSAVPSSLILDYKFDDGTGTTAEDIGTNALNGTLINGPVWTTGGKINGAVTLDGVDDYVSAPTGVLSGVTTATISTWFKVSSASTWARVFDFGTGTTNYMFLTTQYSATSGSNDRLRFAIRTPSVGEQQINSSTATPLGSWVHVAIVLNGSQATLYLNGANVGSNSAMTLNPSSLGSTTQNWIGRSQWSADPYLAGSIDDFRIYSRALSAAEISTLATSARPSTPTGLAVNVVDNSEVDLTWNPVSGATGYTVRRAASSTGPWTTLITGRQTASYSDPGLSPAYYYYMVAAENAGGDSPYTTAIQATILPPDVPDPPANLTVLPSSLTSNYLSWTIGNYVWTQTISRATSPTGPFTAIATGYTGSTYTDAGLTSGTTYYYKVTSENALGTGESSVLSSAPSNLVSYLRFEDAAGVVANDATGHQQFGVLQTGASWNASGKIGSAVSLNGSTGYVSLPLNLVGWLPSITLSAWVNPTSLSTWARVFDFSSTQSDYMFLSVSNGSFPRFAIRTSAVTEQQLTGTAAMPVGAWTHMAVTLTGNTATLYINGVQVNQNTSMTLNPTMLGAINQSYLGKSRYSGDPMLNGKIDDFKVFNRALSSTEVASLAQAVPLSVTNTSDSGAGSLRQAILDANSGFNGNGTISFATASGTQNVQLASQLPELLYPTTLSIPSGSSYGVGTVNAFSLGDYSGLTVSGGGSLTLGGNPTQVAPATFTLSAGALTLNTDLGTNISLVANGTLNIAASQHLAALTLQSGGLATLPGAGKIMVTSALSMNSSAKLDLAGNSLIVRAISATVSSVAASVKSWLATGIGTTGSYWNGNGIRSSTAAADAGHLTALGMLANGYAYGTRFTTFAGEAVGANDVLVKYTYYGDADLSGVVNGGDYASTDNGFNFGGSGWTNGDFNYDGAINGSDYALLDNAFHFQNGPLAASNSPTPLVALQPLSLAVSNEQARQLAELALAGQIVTTKYDLAADDLATTLAGRKRS